MKIRVGETRCHAQIRIAATMTTASSTPTTHSAESEKLQSLMTPLASLS